MATRLLDQSPQYRLADGSLADGGSLTFTDTGTTTARPVYGEPALNTNLGSVLTLGSDARTAVDVWLSGNYRVVLKDSAGVTIWTKNDTRDTVASTYYAVPNPASGVDGQAILTDGTVYYLATLIKVPDPTGASGKFLGNDGLLPIWQTVTIPTYTSTSLPGGIVQGASSFQIGKMLFQYGTSSAPTSANVHTSKAITFGTAYATLWHVDACPSVDGVIDGGGATGVSVSGISRSTTGCTFNFTAVTDHVTDHSITSVVSFTWIAIGLVA